MKPKSKIIITSLWLLLLTATASLTQAAPPDPIQSSADSSQLNISNEFVNQKVILKLKPKQELRGRLLALQGNTILFLRDRAVIYTGGGIYKHREAEFTKIEISKVNSIQIERSLLPKRELSVLFKSGLILLAGFNAWRVFVNR